MEQGPSDSFKQYLGLGFTHILEGIDHLLFLLALFILCKSLRSLFFAATGFTIGHSVTLALAASNIIIPEINIIESLIGWTIVLASIEALNIPKREMRKIQLGILIMVMTFSALSLLGVADFKTGFIIGLGILTLAILRLNEDSEESEKLRPMLAIIFGTIHGFGFANVLNEINLDRTNFLFSLLGFNFGVEIGQILVLLCMLFTESLVMSYVYYSLFQIATPMWVGIAPTTVSDLVLPRMRGVAGAFYILMVSMLGLALGPYSIGYISDYFFSLGYSDAVSLKYALAWGQSALLITIFALIGACYYLPKEEPTKLDRAREMGEPV